MFRGLVFAERQTPAQLQFLAFPNLSNQALTGTWRFDRCNTSMLDKDVASSAEGPDCLMQARPTPGLSLTASKQKQLIMTSVNVFYEMYAIFTVVRIYYPESVRCSSLVDDSDFPLGFSFDPSRIFVSPS